MHIEFAYTERYMDPCTAHSYAQSMLIHSGHAQRYTNLYTAHIGAYNSTYRNMPIPMHTGTMLICRTHLNAEHTHRDTMNQSTHQTESPTPLEFVKMTWGLFPTSQELLGDLEAPSSEPSEAQWGCMLWGGGQTGTHTEQAG